MRLLALLVLLVVSPQLALAAPASDRQKEFMKALDRMMIQLAPQSSQASQFIRQAYRRHMDLLVMEEYAALEGALANGGLVRLPADPLRFNLNPRINGPSPIGERDLDNQESYISARREAVGALIEIASRVRSGPLEITSLARHTEYQSALRKTNANANTSIPMHTMGLAFDIALINTPLTTVYEIRDVLSQMQRAGDILVIGERRQLVFHVVPHPSRLGHFAQVYEDAMADSMPGANIVSLAKTVPSFGVPYVIAEVIAIRPTTEWIQEWWAADDLPSDLVVQVTPTPAEEPTFFGRVAAAVTGLFEVLGL